MSTQTTENYLKAIYAIADKQEKVNLTDVSRHLEVSAATANNMMQKLKKEGLITQEKYQPILLTPKGKKVAAEIIRKHRITEMFLSELMGIGWEHVHHIAEQIEHVDSTLLFDRMDEMLDFPKYDPHGSPIPDKKGNVTSNKAIILNKAEVGQALTVVGVDDSSKALLEHLNELNIGLGTPLSIVKVNSYDNSIVVKIDKAQEVFLSMKVANSLKVTSE